MSEATEEHERRERLEWQERKELELDTANEIRNLAREVGDVKTIATETQTMMNELDRRPPQVEQWIEKTAQVKRNTEAIAQMRPQVSETWRWLKWIAGLLTAAIVAIAVQLIKPSMGGEGRRLGLGAGGLLLAAIRKR